MADRGAGVVPVVCSLMASFMSAITLLGVTRQTIVITQTIIYPNQGLLRITNLSLIWYSWFYSLNKPLQGIALTNACKLLACLSWSHCFKALLKPYCIKYIQTVAYVFLPVFYRLQSASVYKSVQGYFRGHSLDTNKILKNSYECVKLFSTSFFQTTEWMTILSFDWCFLWHLPCSVFGPARL